MLTEEGCLARKRRLWEQLDPVPECVILGIPRHITYFTGYYPSPFSYASQNANALLILKRDGPSKLIVDSVQKRLADSAFVQQVVAGDWYDGRHSASVRSRAVTDKALQILNPRTWDRIAVDFGVARPFIACLGFVSGRSTIIPIDQEILEISRSKLPDEVDAIRSSIRAMEAGYRAARDAILPGVTELQLYTIVHQAVTEFADHRVLVYGDFASGPRAESGGGEPTGRAVQKGDLFLLDYSVVIQGYRGDLCSTFVVDGKPSDRQRQMMECCLEAMREGESKLKAGTPCREVDSAVRSVFSKRNLGDFFKHHSGHGIGLGHPDPPYIVPESSDTLLAGDVVTLEPGCYVPGVGGMRFEHNYHITDSGFERLSNHLLAL